MIKEYAGGSLSGYNVLFFYGAWTKKCITNEQILVDISKKYQINIFKVNSTKYYDMKLKYGIKRIPGYALVLDDELIDNYNGGINIRFLSEWIERYI